MFSTIHTRAADASLRRVRRLADRSGYRLHKLRNGSGYALIDRATSGLVLGRDVGGELVGDDLDTIEAWLGD